jgi:hypothetical protein
VLRDSEAAGLCGCCGKKAEKRCKGKNGELAHVCLHHHTRIDAILGGVVAVDLLLL